MNLRKIVSKRGTMKNKLQFLSPLRAVFCYSLSRDSQRTMQMFKNYQVLMVGDWFTWTSEKIENKRNFCF